MQLQLYLSRVNENRLHNSLKSTKNFVSSPSSWIPLIDLKLCALCAIWYLTSVVSSNSTKSILRDFSFPVTLTELQFLMNAIYCLIAVVFVKRYDTFFRNSRKNLNMDSLYVDESGTLLSSFPKGTFPNDLNDRDYTISSRFLKPTIFILKTTLPMGLFQFVGHIASHNATSIIPVSLVHTIKALSPLTTVLIYRFMFGQRFTAKTYITLLPLITGVMLSCVKNNNILINEDLFYKGCAFAFISMLIFVSQNIFAKKILTYDSASSKEDYFTNALNMRVAKSESASTTPILPISMSPKHMSPPITPLLGNSSQSLNKLVHNAEKKLDKISVLFYCSLVGFVLTLPFYIISEFSNPIFSLSLIDHDIMFLVLVNGLSHFVQSIVAFQILGMVSPINYSIANILKRIIIISCSIILEGTKLKSTQWVGLSLTFIGLYCYDKWGVQRKKSSST